MLQAYHASFAHSITWQVMGSRLRRGNPDRRQQPKALRAAGLSFAVLFRCGI
ncbi:MAG TPA: hypothetical protein VGM00_17025 [Bradyrhizobium sp.]|jgi:hypothetical protein